MTTFTINHENNIVAFASPEEAAAATTTPFDSFSSQQELAELAAPWPAERFVAIWNSMAGVIAHSRMLYLEFTHSQTFETIVRCHVHAFTALGGVAREIAYDNLATAVAEHDGKLVRFLPRFLAFAREYSFYPKACNVAAGWEH